MNKTSAVPTAVERAERILSRRLPAADQPATDPVGQGSVKRAEAQADRLGQSAGQEILRVAARGYVAAALQGQKMIDSVSSAWKESVNQARREQEERTARTQGAAAAKKEAAEEKRGEQTLRQTAGGAEKAADTAGETADVAGAAAGG